MSGSAPNARLHVEREESKAVCWHSRRHSAKRLEILERPVHAAKLGSFGWAHRSRSLGAP